MANFTSLIARLLTRMAMSRTVRSIIKQVKPQDENPNRRRRRARIGEYDDEFESMEMAPQRNYYKIAIQVLFMLALMGLFYLIMEKKIF